MNEFQTKLEKVKRFLDAKGLDGIILSRRESFSWLTCGAHDFVAKFSETGVADLIVMKDKCYVAASEIERCRMMDEEIKIPDFELVSFDWYRNKNDVIGQLTRGRKVASDTGNFNTPNLCEDFRRLRFSLCAEETGRLEELCSRTAIAVQETCREIYVGDTEHEIAANIGSKLMKQGIQLPVCLIAADDRIKKYRHPVPAGNKVKKYALVVVGAEKYGLYVSMSRMVSFGEPDDEILRKQKACLEVDAALIRNTVVGAGVSDIFKAAVNKYEMTGFAGEWKFHHQGGAAGYRAREFLGNFDTEELVQENQMYAWNPTISGTKSEDTILATPQGPRILTEIPGWPMRKIIIDGQEIMRPDILVR